jgi:hypothetical protein
LQLHRAPVPFAPTGSLREARLRFERDYVAAVLQHHDWRMADAAQTLGIQRPNLYRKNRRARHARADVRVIELILIMGMTLIPSRTLLVALSLTSQGQPSQPPAQQPLPRTPPAVQVPTKPRLRHPEAARRAAADAGAADAFLPERTSSDQPTRCRSRWSASPT